MISLRRILILKNLREIKMKKRGELPKPGYFKNQNSYFVKTVCSWYCSQVRRTRLKQLSSSSSNNSIEDKVISLVFPSVYTKLCVCVYVSCSVVSNPVNPWTIVCQAPLSVEFSRQEYWSGKPFPSPVYTEYILPICFHSVNHLLTEWLHS